ncbi:MULTISPECIES: GNAT family N-acetyltransferase [unclassified Bradyrhizobium]
MTLHAPLPIDGSHDVSAFSCGHPSLDDWLKRRAFANQKSGASRTFVVCDEKRVVAYYALAAGALACSEATGKFRRNMPDPIPVAILARLAIDVGFQKQGLGRALFRDASLRILAAASAIGIRGLLIHTISEEAVRFYRAIGVEASPANPRTLMMTLADLQAAL